MNKKNVGEKIKQAVRETGISQQDFSKKINIGENLVSVWAAGKRNPSLSSLKKISKATGKPLSYFIDNANNASGDFMVTEKNYGVVGHQNKGNTVNVNEQSKDYSKLLADKKDMEIELLKKDMEILRLQMELLKRDKRK